MNTKIISIFAAIVAVLGLASCHNDVVPTPDPVQKGDVSLASMSVAIDNAEKVIESRATVDLSDYVVQIFTATGSKVKEWRYADMPGVFELEEGDYRVHVYSHEVQKAEWERPHFVGDKDFTVIAGEITQIGVVTCKFASIKVTVAYTDELRKYMADDCKVTVICNDTGRLDYGIDEKRAGYFAPLEGSSTLVAELTGTIGGNHEVKRVVINDVEGGHHRKITFKIKSGTPQTPDENGGIDPGTGIEIDHSVTDENVSANVGGGEENLDGSDRPNQNEDPEEGGGDDPTPPTPPAKETITITSDDVDFDNINPIKDRVLVKIDSKDGVAHLQVTITTDNQNFAMAVEELMPMSFDLAYPGEYGDSFSGIGFPVGDQVIGATHIDFNISDFVPLLASFPGTHNFQISVTDLKNKQLIKTLSFKAQ